MGPISAAAITMERSSKKIVAILVIRKRVEEKEEEKDLARDLFGN